MMWKSPANRPHRHPHRAAAASSPTPTSPRRSASTDDILDILGQALTIREVDAGSCNGCELEIHALNNPYYNIEGLGIKFVASPRHADMLLVTGPVSRHMEEALRRTYDATPAPKLVVAVGDCGCTGGIFGESYASCGTVSNVIPGRCRRARLPAAAAGDPARDSRRGAASPEPCDAGRRLNRFPPSINLESPKCS